VIEISQPRPSVIAHDVVPLSLEVEQRSFDMTIGVCQVSQEASNVSYQPSAISSS
jgi:hypothetical protein